MFDKLNQHFSFFYCVRGVRKAGVVDLLSIFPPNNKTVFTVKCQYGEGGNYYDRDQL